MMKKDFINFLFCFSALIFAVCTSCGGGGGGGGGSISSLYDPNDGPHNGRTDRNWNGTGNTGGSLGSINSTIVLTGGTDLVVEKYVYNGQSYATAQELIDVLVHEQINGSVSVEVWVDGEARPGRYVVTERGRTLQHPYKVTITNPNTGSTIYSSDSTSSYFYASEGFSLSNLPQQDTKTVRGFNVPFPVDVWTINGTAVAANGTITGFSGDISPAATPTLAKYTTYEIDGETYLAINPDYSGQTIEIPASCPSFSKILIDSDTHINLNLSNARVIDNSGNIVTALDEAVYTNLCMDNPNINLTLPSNITSIASNGFENSTLTSINIPAGIITICPNAFNNCANLSSVNFGSSVQDIQNNAFTNCSSLSSLTIPNSVTHIGNEAFSSTTGSGLTSIDIQGEPVIDSNAFLNSQLQTASFPVSCIDAFNSASSLSNVTIKPCSTSTEIPQGKFSGNNTLTTVTIAEGITKIGNNSFNGCQGIVTITIPDTVTTIGADAIANLYSLSSITIPNSVQTIESGAFANLNTINSVACPLRFADNFKTLSSSRYIELSLSFDGTRTSFASRQFEDCHFSKIVIPEGITSLGDYAFYYGRVNEVVLPDSLIEISSNAFQFSHLSSCVIPNSVQTIGYGAFNGSEFSSITIPDNVTTIGGSAFIGCDNLTEIVIPDSVTTLGNEVFWDCERLTTVTIGSNVTTMGYGIFVRCPALTTIIFRKDPTTINYGGANTFPSNITCTWTDSDNITHTYHWNNENNAREWIPD